MSARVRLLAAGRRGRAYATRLTPALSRREREKVEATLRVAAGIWANAAPLTPALSRGEREKVEATLRVAAGI